MTNVADTEKDQQIAQSLTDSRQWRDAASCWGALARKHRTWPKAYKESIDCHLKIGELEAAIKLLDQARENSVTAPAMALFVAEFESRRGRWEPATDLFDEYRHAFPSHAARLDENPHYRAAIINRFGIEAGNKRLPIRRRSAASAAQDQASDNTDKKKYIFVSGMPRASTTALGHLINESGEAALFVELFNPYLPYHAQDFSPALVEKYTPRVNPSVNQDILKRLNNVDWVGDKRPLFHYSLPQTAQSMKQERVTVLHIVRDPVSVCRSYDKRARDPNDSWDVLRDVNRCIHELNTTAQYFVNEFDAQNLPTGFNILLVDQARVFSDIGYARHIFKLADIPLNEARHSSYSLKSTQLADLNRQLPRHVQSALENLDKELSAKLLAMTYPDY